MTFPLGRVKSTGPFGLSVSRSRVSSNTMRPSTALSQAIRPSRTTL